MRSARGSRVSASLPQSRTTASPGTTSCTRRTARAVRTCSSSTPRPGASAARWICSWPRPCYSRYPPWLGLLSPGRDATQGRRPATLPQTCRGGCVLSPRPPGPFVGFESGGHGRECSDRRPAVPPRVPFSLDLLGGRPLSFGGCAYLIRCPRCPRLRSECGSRTSRVRFPCSRHTASLPPRQWFSGTVEHAQLGREAGWAHAPASETPGISGRVSGQDTFCAREREGGHGTLAGPDGTSELPLRRSAARYVSVPLNGEFRGLQSPRAQLCGARRLCVDPETTRSPHSHFDEEGQGATGRPWRWPHGAGVRACPTAPHAP